MAVPPQKHRREWWKQGPPKWLYEPDPTFPPGGLYDDSEDGPLPPSPPASDDEEERQEEAAILAASGEQHLLTMAVGAGGVPVGHPGARYPAGALGNTGGVHAGHLGVSYPAGVGSVGTGGVHAGGPFGAGYSASVPVIVGPVAQRHIGAGHAEYHTWAGGSVEVPEGAGATHPGLATGAAVASAEGTHIGHATGPAAASDAVGVATSYTPTPPEYADEDEGVADEDKGVADEDEGVADEDEYCDHEEHLRSGGYNDVDPYDPYGLGPQWDDEDDEEEDSLLPIPRTFREIEQEELVVVVDATTSAQRIVTSSTLLLTHLANTDETSTVLSQLEVYVRPAERRRSRRSSGPASWGGLILPFREESDSPSLGSSSTSQASSSSSRSSRFLQSSKSGTSKQSGELSDRARRHRDSKERKRRLRRRERDEGQTLTPAALAATFRECLREFHGQEGDRQSAPNSAPHSETAPLAETTSPPTGSEVELPTEGAGETHMEQPGDAAQIMVVPVEAEGQLGPPGGGRQAGANSEEAALQQKAGKGGAAQERETSWADSGYPFAMPTPTVRSAADGGRELFYKAILMLGVSLREYLDMGGTVAHPPVLLATPEMETHAWVVDRGVVDAALLEYRSRPAGSGNPKPEWKHKELVTIVGCNPGKSAGGRGGDCAGLIDEVFLTAVQLRKHLLYAETRRLAGYTSCQPAWLMMARRDGGEHESAYAATATGDHPDSDLIAADAEAVDAACLSVETVADAAETHTVRRPEQPLSYIAQKNSSASSDAKILDGPQGGVQEHYENVRTFLQTCREKGVYLKASKAQMLKESLKFLGHTLSSEGCSPQHDKVATVRDWPALENATHVRQFLGLAGYYRRFIHCFSDIAQPLTMLTKNDVEWKWGPEQRWAFEELKAALVDAPVLALPNVKAAVDGSAPFLVQTDASGVALGGVLMQDCGEGLKVIAYESRQFFAAEQNYHTGERELCGLHHCTTVTWRHYLIFTAFKLQGDHRPLEWLMEPGRELSRRQARWYMDLVEVGVPRMEYVKGALLLVPDALSRRPDYAVKTPREGLQEAGILDAKCDLPKDPLSVLDASDLFIEGPALGTLPRLAEVDRWLDAVDTLQLAELAMESHADAGGVQEHLDTDLPTEACPGADLLMEVTTDAGGVRACPGADLLTEVTAGAGGVQACPGVGLPVKVKSDAGGVAECPGADLPMEATATPMKRVTFAWQHAALEKGARTLRDALGASRAKGK
eukprot:gene27566-biopygen28580